VVLKQLDLWFHDGASTGAYIRRHATMPAVVIMVGTSWYTENVSIQIDNSSVRKPPNLYYLLLPENNLELLIIRI
jgi:hypothetical protein